ncbi:hypothetical protein [Pseudomonas sp. MF6747]|uniref:hypothetical protein n=1 Tax=Pseudomonas sp. MF6747 TaxID=2797527 RepID=UPI00190C64E2|nr:hypothetical protein [Pseudomonas sp. MF6747]MBK3506627.1 hypothetical protein [Pseudomonas sp. MF6747]
MNKLEEQIRKLEQLEKEMEAEHEKRNTSALSTTPEKLLKKEETQSKDTKNIKCKSREVRLILETDSDLYRDIKELEAIDPLFEFNRATLRKIAEAYIKDRLRKMKD